MTRSRWLLTGLATVLLGAAWFLLMWSPTSDEIAQVDAERESVEAQAAQLRTRAAELRQVREEAPEAAAVLAAATTLVPEDAALPPLLRQMQIAADEAGVLLHAVSTGRPANVEGAPAGLASIDVNLSAQGTYYQLVDVLRRLEDPSITGRGVVWRSASIAVAEEYPDLTLTLSARVYSRMDANAVADAPAGEAEGEAAAETSEGTDAANDGGEMVPQPAEPVPGGANEGEIQ